MDPVKKMVQEKPTPELMGIVAVPPLFVFALFLMTAMVLAGLIYRWTNSFSPTDPRVELKYVTPEKTKTFKAVPIPVYVGLVINNFIKFDMTRDEFLFEGLIWFEYDPTLISLDTLKQVTFERATIESWSAPSTELVNDLMLVRFNIRVRFTNYNNYAYFPLDDHRLSLLLVHKNAKLDQIMFVSNDSYFVIAQDMSFRGWHEEDRKVVTGYLQEQLDQFNSVAKGNVLEYPAALFTMDYGRKSSIRNVFTIVLPMLLLVFIALFSIVVDREKNFSLVMTLPIQALVGLVSFRFVVEALSPQAGYFLWSDFIFFSFYQWFFLCSFYNLLPFSCGPFGKRSSLSSLIV